MDRTRIASRLTIALAAGALAAGALAGPVELERRVESRTPRLTIGFGAVTVDAATFFAGCPSIVVERETIVNGTASVDGDCTIHVERRRNLSLRELELDVSGELTIAGSRDVDVNVGNDNCPDNQVCAGAAISAGSFTIDVDGNDGRARVFFSSIEAGTISITAQGADAELRVHNGELISGGEIVLRAGGDDARVRVRTENEPFDRNTLVGTAVSIVSTGGDSETLVEHTDLIAETVTILSDGETRAEDNDFGNATVTLAGGDDCREDDNTPSVQCQ